MGGRLPSEGRQALQDGRSLGCGEGRSSRMRLLQSLQPSPSSPPAATSRTPAAAAASALQIWVQPCGCGLREQAGGVT